MSEGRYAIKENTVLSKSFRYYIINTHDKNLNLFDKEMLDEDFDELFELLKGHSYIEKVTLPRGCDNETKVKLRKILNQNKKYQTNLVASLRNLSIFQRDSSLDRVEKSSDLIIEHAARRVDLFFYTLVHYYNKKWEIYLDDTDRDVQHGEGDRKLKTEASHSALISNPFGFVRALRADNAGPLNFKILWPKDNYFYQTLNSTVELPHESNVFDRILEGQVNNPSPWRAAALNLLNDVSQGILNPIQGLERFFKILDDFFNSEKILSKYLNSPDEAQRLIVSYQYEGTFDGRWENSMITDAYLCSLLGLSEEEIELLDSENFIAERFEEMKLEILRGKIAKPVSNSFRM